MEDVLWSISTQADLCVLRFQLVGFGALSKKYAFKSRLKYFELILPEGARIRYVLCRTGIAI